MGEIAPRSTALLMTLAPLLVPLLGLGLIVGLIRPGKIIGCLVGTLMLPLIMMVGEALFRTAPWWMSVLFLAIAGLWLLRALVALLFNRQIADDVTARLLTDGIRWGLRILFFPFHLLMRLPRRRL